MMIPNNGNFWLRQTPHITSIATLGPIQITFEELKKIATITENRRFVCVCNWSIRRNWTGILLEDLFDNLGINPPRYRCYNLKQLSLGTAKGVYDSATELSNAFENRAMIIWAIDGVTLSLKEGYPIRLVDFSLYRYKGVKCLSKLHITDEFRGTGKAKRAIGAIGAIVKWVRSSLKDIELLTYKSIGSLMILVK